MSSGFREHVQKDGPFLVVQALVQAVYDDDRRVCNTLQRELAKGSKNEMLELMSGWTVKDVRIFFDRSGDYMIRFRNRKCNVVSKSCNN